MRTMLPCSSTKINCFARLFLINVYLHENGEIFLQQCIYINVKKRGGNRYRRSFRCRIKFGIFHKVFGTCKRKVLPQKDRLHEFVNFFGKKKGILIISLCFRNTVA